MKKLKHALLVASLLIVALAAHAQIITTVAGGDTILGDGGPATDCEMYHPESLVFDAIGNYYITDRDYSRIRKVDTAGIITTIAGGIPGGYNGDNIPATAAGIRIPYGIVLDAIGNIYFADALDYRVRKINTAGIITTVAGIGSIGYNGDNIAATLAKLNTPTGIAFDNIGNMYITEQNGARIRKVDTSGIITTFAGNGSAGYNGDGIPATDAEVNGPMYLSIKTGNMFIADSYNNRIRKVDAMGIIHTIAGNDTPGYSGDNGQAINAKLNQPIGIYTDDLGNVYIGDTYNNVIRKVNAAGIITTIAGDNRLGYSGDGGAAIAAELFYPCGIAFNSSYNLYFADFGNNRIRMITSTLQTAIVNASRDKITIYPNPCNGNFFINIASGDDKEVQATITNTLGEIIKKITVHTNQPVNVHLDERAGVYFVFSSSREGTLSAKLVVSP